MKGRDMTCFADYWLNLTGKSWYNSTRPAYTEWISMSTGHLSAELDHESQGVLISLSGSSVPSNTKSLPRPIPLHGVSSEDLFILATGIQFRVSLWDSPDEISIQGTFMVDAPMQDVYLFLFDPCVRIQNGRTSVKIPATSHAYYWSFQHDGSTRLSDEMLEEIVPPQVLFEARIVGHTWSDVDYELIRDFLLAKGFNPNSNDAALELGYPLAAVHDEPIQVPLQADSHEPHLDDFPRPSGVCYYCEKVEQLAYQIWRHQSSCNCDENIQQTSCKNPGIDQIPEHPDVPEDMLVPQTFKFFINIQLTLILFLTLSWLYDQVSEGMRFK
ncbi:hypothetical protein MVEN_00714500 [Mycena venus]|uniref:Uncharacterized protein n=1 Tax=Mycena venus TaxID=2733690 RepID=A0A8H6YHJ0_9AGAR|nr:hypothetical protein MVEN_00714500 [Mycena venus]